MCRCCFGSVEGESCGWPAGTVRAILTLIVIPIAFGVACAIIIILVLREQYNIALGVNSGIWGVVGTIIGYYFGSKQGENAARLLSETGRNIINSRNLELNRDLKKIQRDLVLRHNVPNDVFLHMNDHDDSEIVVRET